MSSSIGNTVKLSLFGESHGDAVGAILEGLPAGIELNEEKLLAFMKRRQGGNSPYTTPRKEADLPRFLSGVYEGKTGGTPIAVTIESNNKRSGDYQLDLPRPSHADYAARMRFGETVDLRGGGHFSARLTSALCAVGYLCIETLEKEGIFIGTHLSSVGNVSDIPFDPVHVSCADFDRVLAHDFPTLDETAAEQMKKEIAEASLASDSVGGTVECAVIGMKAGYGTPLFDGVENKLSAALFALGGVRGIEFGCGFAASSMRGSAHNDAFRMQNGEIVTETNRHAGILGGMTSGMPILFRLAFKPTASIALPQNTVSLSKGENAVLELHGRHDPCIALRALPCVEAMTAITLADIVFGQKGNAPACTI